MKLKNAAHNSFDDIVLLNTFNLINWDQTLVCIKIRNSFSWPFFFLSFPFFPYPTHSPWEIATAFPTFSSRVLGKGLRKCRKCYRKGKEKVKQKERARSRKRISWFLCILRKVNYYLYLQENHKWTIYEYMNNTKY